jgi:hypothetical protein
MATDTVITEDIGFRDAKERAAAILYGTDKDYPDTRWREEAAAKNQTQAKYEQDRAAEQIVAEYSVPIREEIKTPQAFKPYRIHIEQHHAAEPHVVHPVAGTNVNIKTNKASALDADLEDNAKYVVRFKASTVVTAAAAAVVLVLLAVLFIVNAVNIAATNAELDRLTEQHTEIAAELDNATNAANAAKDNTIKDIENNLGSFTDIPAGKLPADKVIPYQPPVDLESSTNFFDIICKFLSKLFG